MVCTGLPRGGPGSGLGWGWEDPSFRPWAVGRAWLPSDPGLERLRPWGRGLALWSPRDPEIG